MLWFNFVHGLNFLKLIIIDYHTIWKTIYCLKRDGEIWLLIGCVIRLLFDATYDTLVNTCKLAPFSGDFPPRNRRCF